MEDSRRQDKKIEVVIEKEIESILKDILPKELIEIIIKKMLPMYPNCAKSKVKK
ncbi:MAG: hypothetical protein ACP5OB_07470 [Candidatus Ratteibacteria bacterium]